MAKNNYTVLIIVTIIIMVILIGPKLMNGTLFSVVEQVDQSQTVASGYQAIINGADRLGQTYITSGNTSKITIKLRSGDTSSTFYQAKVSIWDSTSKSILFASTQNQVSLTTTPQDFDFPMNLGQGYLIPGTSYYFEITNVGSGTFYSYYSSTNTYNNGKAYFTGLESNTNDLYFKTYNMVQQTCRTDADTDCNNAISDAEIIAYGAKWTSGQITRAQLANSIQSWSIQ